MLEAVGELRAYSQAGLETFGLGGLQQRWFIRKWLLSAVTEWMSMADLMRLSGTCCHEGFRPRSCVSSMLRTAAAREPCLLLQHSPGRLLLLAVAPRILPKPTLDPLSLNLGALGATRLNSTALGPLRPVSVKDTAVRGKEATSIYLTASSAGCTDSGRCYRDLRVVQSRFLCGFERLFWKL